MFEKTISLLTIDNEYNPDVNLLVASLKVLRWRIQIKLLPQDSLILSNEIEKSVKHNQITILIGEYTDEVAKSLMNVFYQNLIDVRFGPIPKHARFLDEPTNTVLYVQSLIVIPITSCNIYNTFENIIKPFLTSSATTKSAVTLNHDDGKIKNGVRCEFSNEIDSVYAFSLYKHVRKSVESIEKCFAQYRPDNVFISFNGGKDCTVLLHMTLAVLKQTYPEYSKKPLCLYVENADSFNEITDFVAACETFYKLDIIKVTKNIKEALTDILHDKPNLKACLMGTRRTDPFSEHLEIFQMTDSDWPQVMRVSPLLDWHYSEIWDYLLTLKVPYCSLYDMGFTSLGNVNNTVKNPSLHEYNNETYLPAYKLLDASQERLGRTGWPAKVIIDK